MTNSTPYPEAERDERTDTLHGQVVADPYRWLEDAESKHTERWLEGQEDLFRERRKDWDQHEGFKQRLTQLLASGAIGAPVWRGQRQFFLRRTPDQEHSVLLTIDPDGTERVLVDPIELDLSGTTTLDAWQPSKEGDLLAYQISRGGTEESEIVVLDVATGRQVDGPIDRTRSSPIAWLPDGKAFYYVRRLHPDDVPKDERQYHRRIWLHQVGAHPDDDVIVFGADLDKTTYYGVTVSRDGRWLIVSAALGTAPRNDVWMADLTAGSLDAPRFAPLQVGVDARVGARVGRDGKLYAWTDRDAPRGQLKVADLDNGVPPYEQWRTLVAQDDDAVLEDYAILDGPELQTPLLVTSWTEHAVSKLAVHDLATGQQTGEVELPGVGSVGGVGERPEGGHECWFGYTDYGTPSSIWRYDARTGECTIWATPPGTVDNLPDIGTRQVTYTSFDGTEIRMFVISPADGDPDQPRPTILYGYGGFGISLTPAFSAGILSWVEAGGVYAIANLRGGGEEGEDWHRAGMRDQKQRVFDDFLAAGDWLTRNGWTTPDLLAISGGSNGGLLVGAALTQRPQAFRAVVCSAPLLDMVRYERSGLGQLWTDEYGTVSNEEEFGWLYAYSPYHRVVDGMPYPAVLFTVFDGDTRVDTLHARKLAAALQHSSASHPATHPILLRNEREVGHSNRALSRTVELSSDTLAFLAWATGLRRG